MKAPAVKVKAERSNLVMADSIPVIDSQGLHDDDVFLSSATWEVLEDVEDHVTYQKLGGTLRLRGGQDEDNQHRIKWEMTIHTNEVQVGYAALTLRPGDMNGSTTKRLIEEALEAAEAEFNKWSDALSAARALLQRG
jgi:hypothetical protein